LIRGAGLRPGDGHAKKMLPLLPAPQELEKLPESASSLRFEEASFREFALFWPSRKHGGANGAAVCTSTKGSANARGAVKR